MRRIDHIAIHCTATPQTTTPQSILNYWKDHLGWKNPGYHYLVSPDGEVHPLLPEVRVSNGVRGYNSHGINVAYIGGIDAFGQPKDTRTFRQKLSLRTLLIQIKSRYPEAIIKGHRDFPGVKKACPSFDAQTEYRSL